MIVRHIGIAVVFSLFIACATSSAQTRAGVFNSPQGFGLCLDTGHSGDSFNSFSAYADIYGVVTGRAIYPGFKFQYLRNTAFKTFESGDAMVRIYAGAGASAGYVHDFEKRSDHLTFLQKGLGACAAIAGDAGCMLTYSDISVDLSFCAEAGFHAKSEDGAFKLSLYRNGLYQFCYPRLRIMWNF